MLDVFDEDHLVEMIRESVTQLCKNAFHYNMELSVEGLLGITLDKTSVMLISIKDNVQVKTMQNDLVPVENRNSVPVNENTGKRNGRRSRKAEKTYKSTYIDSEEEENETGLLKLETMDLLEKDNSGVIPTDNSNLPDTKSYEQEAYEENNKETPQLMYDPAPVLINEISDENEEENTELPHVDNKKKVRVRCIQTGKEDYLPWPSPYEFPLERLDSKFTSNLRSGLIVSESQIRYLADAVYMDVIQYTHYPQNYHFEEVIGSLIKTFPALKHPENYTDVEYMKFWCKRLRWKFRNQRKRNIGNAPAVIARKHTPNPWCTPKKRDVKGRRRRQRKPGEMGGGRRDTQFRLNSTSADTSSPTGIICFPQGISNSELSPSLSDRRVCHIDSSYTDDVEKTVDQNDTAMDSESDSETGKMQEFRINLNNCHMSQIFMESGQPPEQNVVVIQPESPDS